ncbi:alanine racemase [Pannonibacter sp. Pt2-lr]
MARAAAALGADRWTVSTLKEAEYFAGHGLTDMLYTLSIVPQKVERIMRLNRAGADIAVCLDTLDGAKALAEMNLEGPGLRVFLEIDVDHHRTGLQPGDGRILDVARSVAAAPHLILAGVMAHGGDSYSAKDMAGIVAMAEQERRITVAAAEAIRAEGIPCPIVSVGSSPTAARG